VKNTLLNAYSAKADRFDEALTPNGEFRRCFVAFGKHIDAMGDSDFLNRAMRADKFLKEFAENYRTSKESAISLDVIPLIYDAEEWKTISSGLSQRSRLFNAILADLYGEQKILKEKVIPPELIYANPFFLRALWGYKPPKNLWIHLFASDVFRGPKGNFYAETDYVQVPPGLGSSLENRLAMVRSFSEIFREIRSDRVALFFKNLRETLRSISPVQTENPRVVFISPGAGSRRAEDAQLARYLGFPLVETEDLTLRGQHLYLKTLAGLKPVEILFRRLEDSLCDPLELRTEGGEGTSGLVASVHSGSVSVANALGSGALEVNGFRCFLNELCEVLLGESLLLPSPPGIWLKDSKAQEEVFADSEKYLFRRFLGKPCAEEKNFLSLTSAGKLSLLREVQRDPSLWMAEKFIPHSTVPAFNEDGFFPAETTARLYAAALVDGGYDVMPGGFAKFSYTKDGVVYAGEKDVWVLSKGPVTTFSLLAPKDEQISISRAGGDLPSHAADNLFWLGRYMERAEFTAREIRALAVRILEQNALEVPEVAPILKHLRKDHETGLPFDAEGTLWCLTIKSEQEGGLGVILEQISRLSTQLRDRLTEDTWKMLNAYSKTVSDSLAGSSALLPILESLVSGGTAFGGIVSDNFTRGHGWRFLEIGRCIERAGLTLDLLASVLQNPMNSEDANVALDRELLEIGDATMTYLRRYGDRMQLFPVLDLFLCDETNPRSVLFQLDMMRREWEHLPNAELNEILSEGARILLRISTDVKLCDINKLSLKNLGEWSSSLARFSDILSQEYLGHAPANHTAAMATEV